MSTVTRSQLVKLLFYKLITGKSASDALVSGVGIVFLDVKKLCLILKVISFMSLVITTCRQIDISIKTTGQFRILALEALE